MTLTDAQGYLDDARRELAKAHASAEYRLGSRGKRSQTLRDLIAVVRYWENEVAKLSGGRAASPIFRPISSA